MSTVDSFILMITSSVVRDVYQRTINPQAAPATLRLMSYGVDPAHWADCNCGGLVSDVIPAVRHRVHRRRLGRGLSGTRGTWALLAPV